MARSENNLTAVFTDTAAAIRAKANTTERICPLDFADKINAIKTDGGGMKAYFDAGGKCSNSNATSFNGIIKYSDTANVEDARYLFQNCEYLKSIPNMDTSKWFDCRYAFANNRALVDVDMTFPTGNNFTNTFYGCSSLVTAKLTAGGPDITMTECFKSNPKLKNVIINAPHLYKADYCFYNSYSLETITISDVDMPNYNGNFKNLCRRSK